MGRIKFDVTIGAFGSYPTVEAKGSAEYPNEFRDFMRNIYSTLGHEVFRDTETKKASELDADEVTFLRSKYMSEFNEALIEEIGVNHPSLDTISGVVYGILEDFIPST